MIVFLDADALIYLIEGAEPFAADPLAGTAEPRLGDFTRAELGLGGPRGWLMAKNSGL